MNGCRPSVYTRVNEAVPSASAPRGGCGRGAWIGRMVRGTRPAAVATLPDSARDTADQRTDHGQNSCNADAAEPLPRWAWASKVSRKAERGAPTVGSPARAASR